MCFGGVLLQGECVLSHLDHRALTCDTCRTCNNVSVHVAYMHFLSYTNLVLLLLMTLYMPCIGLSWEHGVTRVTVTDWCIMPLYTYGKCQINANASWPFHIHH